MIEKTLAQVNVADPTLFPPAKFSNLGSLLNIIMPLVIVFGSLILLFVVIFGGFKMLTAGGNPEEIKKGQQIFTTSVIGFIIIVFAYLFVRIIGRIFNISFPF